MQHALEALRKSEHFLKRLQRFVKFITKSLEMR